MKSKLIQTLDWSNLEEVPEPLTPLKLKTYSSVLTKNLRYLTSGAKIMVGSSDILDL